MKEGYGNKLLIIKKNRKRKLCLLCSLLVSMITFFMCFVSLLTISFIYKFSAKKTASSTSFLKLVSMAEAITTETLSVGGSSLLLQTFHDSNSGRSPVKFRVVKLQNGLRVFLISSQHATKSGAALSVATGAFDDPEEFPGMAHLCEHMIFRGHQSCEDELCRYTIFHGGYYNGLTKEQMTSFMFTLSSKYFEKAFTSFSNLFKNPLFNDFSLMKELNIVNEEQKKNLQNDAWIVWHLLKHVSNHEHPFHRFDVGNLETLNKSDTLSRLKQFYKEKYTVNRVS